MNLLNRVSKLRNYSLSKYIRSITDNRVVNVISSDNELQPHALQKFELNFLGTGTASPSRFRNKPSILLDLGKKINKLNY